MTDQERMTVATRWLAGQPDPAGAWREFMQELVDTMLAYGYTADQTIAAVEHISGRVIAEVWHQTAAAHGCSGTA